MRGTPAEPSYFGQQCLLLCSPLVGARVLDIGCAEGSFLSILRRLRADLQLSGVEPSEGFVEYARSVALGADIRCAVFRGSDYEEGTFDLVCASHVMEHTLDPRRFMSECSGIVKRGGGLFLEVPVGDRQRPGNYFHIAHLNHFTLASLRQVVEQAGFHVTRMDRAGSRGGIDGAYRVFAVRKEEGVAAIVPKGDEVAAIRSHFKSYKQRMRGQQVCELVARMLCRLVPGRWGGMSSSDGFNSRA